MTWEGGGNQGDDLGEHILIISGDGGGGDNE